MKDLTHGGVHAQKSSAKRQVVSSCPLPFLKCHDLLIKIISPQYAANTRRRRRGISTLYDDPPPRCVWLLLLYYRCPTHSLRGNPRATQAQLKLGGLFSMKYDDMAFHIQVETSPRVTSHSCKSEVSKPSGSQRNISYSKTLI